MPQNDAAPDATTNGHHPTLAERLRRGALPLPARRPRNPALLKDAEQRAANVQNRIADRITAFSGSMAFVYLHVIWFGCWIGFGVEKYPFGLLTMIVSLEAIFLSTFVMISQNRADAKRQLLADEQWKTVQEEDEQNEELLDLSKQILDLTKEVHAYYESTSGPASSLEHVQRRREVVGAAHRTREVGQPVAHAVAGRPEHAREHPVVARPLSALKATKYSPCSCAVPKGTLRRKISSSLPSTLASTRAMCAVRGFSAGEFDAVGLRPPEHPLLVFDSRGD